MYFNFKVKGKFANDVINFSPNNLDYLIFETADELLVLLMHGVCKDKVKYKNHDIYLSEAVDELQKDSKLPIVKDLLFLGCYCGQLTEFVSTAGTQVKSLGNIPESARLLFEREWQWALDEDVVIEVWPPAKSGRSEENMVLIYAPDKNLQEMLQTLDEHSLASFFGKVSSVEFVDKPVGRELEGWLGCWIKVQPCPYPKCDRCWRRSLTVKSRPDHPSLCERCYDVVIELQKSERSR